MLSFINRSVFSQQLELKLAMARPGVNECLLRSKTSVKIGALALVYYNGNFSM